MSSCWALCVCRLRGVWDSIFVIASLVAVITFFVRQEYGLMILAGSASFLAISIKDWLAGNTLKAQRRDFLDRIKSRPYASLSVEIDTVAKLSGASTKDVERLWHGLANFYGVPSAAIRALDLLSEELAGLTDQPTYDPFNTPIVIDAVCHRALETSGIRTWGQLIAFFYNVEQSTGLLGTTTANKGDCQRIVWDGIGRRYASNHCQSCGYNLFGTSGAVCPECGVRTEGTAILRNGSAVE